MTPDPILNLNPLAVRILDSNGNTITIANPLPTTATISGVELVVGTVTAGQGKAADPSGAWPVSFTDGTSLVNAADNTLRAVRVTVVPPYIHLTDVSYVGQGLGAAASGAGLRNYITSLTASNTSGQIVIVNYFDGVNATNVQSFSVAPSGGNVTPNFPTPIRQSANTALVASLTAAVTDVRVSAQGYTAP